MDSAGGVAQAAPRLTIIVAHPDDEIIGAGATLLPRFPNCAIVHVTDGAPSNLQDARAAGFLDARGYSAARRREAANALSLAGISSAQIVELDFADQATSYELEGMARRVADLLRRTRPDVVVTHPYEGGHPDHDSTAFAVHAARRASSDEGLPFAILELTSYHARDGSTVHSDFLPREDCPATTFVLTGDERDLKCRMFDCFTTQQEVLRWFPVEVERFRRAPAYDFTTAPHGGQLNYERYDWGMSGMKWRRLAHHALLALKREARDDDATHGTQRSVSSGDGRARCSGWS